jgi:DNA-binding transcriptional ArsR family regulator
MSNSQNEHLEAWLEAVNHLTRRTILVLLWEQESEQATSPKDLSEELGGNLPSISYHVRVLCDCDAVELVRTRQVRGSVKHFYRLARRFRKEKWVIAVLEQAAGAR